MEIENLQKLEFFLEEIKLSKVRISIHFKK